MVTERNRPMSRRHFLLTAAGAASAALLAACSSSAPAAQTSAGAKPVGTAAPAAGSPSGAKTKLVWWHHPAEEENTKRVVNTVSKWYTDAHPNVEVEAVWWQKAQMFPALRSAFSAGSGFPDIFYWDLDAIEFASAGWAADLSALNWNEVEPWAADLKFPGPDGKQGRFGLVLEVTSDEIYYNKSIFDKLGIKVPANYQFSADEFYSICKQIRAAGIDPFANGIGDRPYPGAYITNFVLLSALGEEALINLNLGKKSWKDDDVVAALTYVKKLIDIPVMPATFSTMKLAEAHIYFHTQQKAAMFLCGSWYANRAFNAPEKGGQPADFRLGFLRYPAMPGGKGNDLKYLMASSYVSVAEKSPNKKVAMDLVQSMMTEKFGNFYVGVTTLGTGMKTNPSKIETPYQWYFDEMAKSHQGQRYAMGKDWQTLMPPVMADAYKNVVNSGFPLGLLSVDDVVKKMEEARAQVKK